MQLRLLLLLFACIASRAQTPVKICEPAPAVREELNRVRLEALSSTGRQRSELTKKLAEAALTKFRDDYFVHRNYQTLGMRAGPGNWPHWKERRS